MRVTLHIFTALSLILFAVSLLLWMRSFSTTDSWQYHGRSDFVGLYNSQGSLVALVEEGGQANSNGDGWQSVSTQDVKPIAQDPWRLRKWADTSGYLGFYVHQNNDNTVAIVVSWWLVAGHLLILPGLWIYLCVIRPHWRVRKGQCSACGYDLKYARRQQIDNCPECGAATVKAVR